MLTSGSVRHWDAASSMASGMPSSRRQMVATAAAVSAASVNDGWARLARSTNSRTESMSARAARSSTSGTVRAGTGQVTSPGRPSGSRLVASTVSSPASTSASATKAAAASMTCSQLSRTNRVGAPATVAASWPAAERPGCSRAPRADNTAPATACGSSMGPSSIHQTPPGCLAPASPATASASRVLPTPPGPSSVTRRPDSTSSTTASTSSRRPTSGVSGTGRRGSTARAGGSGWSGGPAAAAISAARSPGSSSRASARSSTVDSRGVRRRPRSSAAMAAAVMPARSANASWVRLRATRWRRNVGPNPSLNSPPPETQSVGTICRSTTVRADSSQVYSSTRAVA